jgi:type IV pilus assembly protein PilB
MAAKRTDITKLLVEKKLITAVDLDNVKKVHASKGGSLSDLLIELGYVSEQDLMIFLSTYLSVPPIKIANLKIPLEIIKLVPKELVLKYNVFPVAKMGNTLTLATTDPLNILVFEDIERVTGYEINPVITSRSQMRQALNKYYQESVTNTIDAIIQDSKKSEIEIIKEKKEQDQDKEVMQSLEDAPVIKLTNYILKRAVQEKASDILIEPLAKESRVRYRLDGILHEVEKFPKKMHNFVISRIKVMSNLNITEHRLPQEGRFQMKIAGKDIDFRISVLPSIIGEKAALRILDKSAGLLDIETLGFEDDVAAKIKRDSMASYGMLLVCGPTGSGKTTTLYSVLNHIYSPDKNIVTVEDPIEYQLRGINQVNVNYDVNLTFASALRSILRQDPDIIMVGEIRDRDTVDIGIKAALTGHLLLSTLHTTTAVGSVTRLINMGVEPFLLSSTLVGVFAQRLVRKLCPRCRRQSNLDKKIKNKYNLGQETIVYKPQGCKFCANTGYRGRLAIGEYLGVTGPLKELITKSASENEIKQAAQSQGMRSLQADGILKVAKGLTSLEEVIKAAGDI